MGDSVKSPNGVGAAVPFVLADGDAVLFVPADGAGDAPGGPGVGL